MKTIIAFLNAKLLYSLKKTTTMKTHLLLPSLCVILACLGLLFIAPTQTTNSHICEADHTTTEKHTHNHKGVCNLPAPPEPFEYQQANGTSLTVFIKGSGFTTRFESVDGYTLAKAENGDFYYAINANNGALIPSDVFANNPANRSAEELSYLSQTEKHLLLEGVALDRRLEDQEASRAYTGSDFPTTGTQKQLLILVEFSDKSFTHSAAEYNNFMNQPGYTGGGNAGSFKDFYLDMSYGQLTVNTDVFGWYTLPNTFTHYTTNYIQLVTDALALADPDVDFSIYDNDGDGKVDNVSFIYAASVGEVGGTSLWPHKGGISLTPFDGVNVGPYFMQQEKQNNGQIGPMGIFCHEFGHALGLPDLYDYDASPNNSPGIGSWCLMAGGAWGNGGLKPIAMNAWCRSTLGWTNPTVLSGTGSISNMDYLSNSGEVYKFVTDVPTEYFLVSNRQKQGYDEFLPGEGISVLHIDETQSLNTNDCNRWVDVIQADGLFQLNTINCNNPGGDITPNQGDTGDLYPGSSGNTTLSDTSTPNCKKYDGSNSNMSLTNMSESGTSTSFSYSGGCLSAITVSSGADSGPGSLREAVASICTDGTITLDAGLTINLTSQINITRSMSIRSANQGVGSTINGGGSTKLFNITSGNPTFYGINFTGGNEGAMSLTNATTFIFNCNFYNNSSSGNGGAMSCNNCSAYIYSVAFYNNTASANGGAIVTTGTSGTLVTINTTFYNNTAATVGGAIASYGLGHDMTLNFNTFYANTATNSAGGAIYEEGNTVNSKASIYYGNTANGNTNNFNIVGTLQSYGSNIFEISGGANTFNTDPSDQFGADPVFGSLVSPEAGSNQICQSYSTQPWGAAFNGAADCDEINTNTVSLGANGIARPTNGACDIGAYEHAAITAACDDINPLLCGASAGDNTGNYLYLGCQSKLYARVYEYTPSNSGDLNVSLHSFTGDMDIAFYDDLCNTNCSALAGSYSTGTTESFTYTVTAGTTYYLLVYGYSNTQSSYALDVTCPTPPPACDYPTNIVCIPYSGNVARANWTVATDGQRYRVRYRTVGGSWTEVLTANTENFRYLNGLMPNTTYEYQMKTQCTDVNSVWSPTQTFTTLGTVCDLTAITSHTATTSTAMLNWTSDPADEKYRLKYRPKGTGGSWIQVDNITNTFLNISGLSVGTEYKVKIKVRCEAGWTQWQTNYDFFTDAPSIVETPNNSRIVGGDINVFPNPAKNIVNIDLKNLEVEQLRILNTSGQVLLQKATRNSTEQVNISDLPSGLYMISIITTDQEVITKQFVKN